MSNEMTTAKREATLTIQQMATRSGLSEYTLRYYEKIGLMFAAHADMATAFLLALD